MDEVRIKEIKLKIKSIEATIEALRGEIESSSCPCCACCHNAAASEMFDLEKEKTKLEEELKTLMNSEDE